VLGRWGYEMFPGIYGPAVLGIYALDSNRIRLFGYVKVPDRAVTEEQNRELRFEMLETLVHELAHHDDRTRRTARGRWRMDDRRKDEQYAVALEQEWCVEVVLPYLLARYGEGDE
jgi:hypothetical protein